MMGGSLYSVLLTSSPAEDGVVTKEAIQNWMNSERYIAFPEVSGGSINEMADVKKYLIIVVVNPDIKDRMDVNNR